MNVFDKMKLAINTFRAAPQLASRVDYGLEERPETVRYQDLYSTSAAVYACIKKRADAFSRPVLLVYRRRNGVLEEVLDHPLRRLLDQINPFWTRIQLWRAIETDLCWHGNAFIGLEQDAQSKMPIELWKMRPDWVKVVPDKQNYIKGYLYSVEGVDYAWKPEEVIHLRYANPLNEYWGLAPLAAARWSAELGIDAIKYNKMFFQNASTPSAALISKVALNKEQADDLTARWNAAYSGISKAHRTAVLSPDLTVQTLTISQRDAEWMNAMKWALSEVARVYGVPEPLIGEEKAVYKNIKEAESALWHETLIPEHEWIQGILNAELVPLFSDSSLLVAWDLTSIEAIQEDVSAKVDRYAKLLDKGVMTINEVRRKEMIGADVAWGNLAWMPSNLLQAGTPAPKEAKAPEVKGEKTEVVEESIAKRSLLQTEPETAVSNEIPEVQLRSINWDVLNDMEKTLVDFLNKEKEVIANAYSRSVRQAGYDWERWHALEYPLAQGMASQMNEAASDAFVETQTTASFDQKNVKAVEWAKTNAAQRVTNITDFTRMSIQKTVTTGIEQGWARDKLANAIRQNTAFSAYRGQLIARTETERAFNTGSMQGYRQSGVVKGKEWLDMEGGTCDECLMNANAGVHGLDEVFPSGDDAPPAHPNCRCRIKPVLDERAEDMQVMQFNGKDTLLPRFQKNFDITMGKLPTQQYLKMNRMLTDPKTAPRILPRKQIAKLYSAETNGMREAPSKCAGFYSKRTKATYIIADSEGTMTRSVNWTLNHEIAHQMHYNVLPVAHRYKISKLYQRRLSSQTPGEATNFVSRYASTDEFEYFAESFKNFVQNPSWLQQTDLEMYNLLKGTIFKGAELL